MQNVTRLQCVLELAFAPMAATRASQPLRDLRDLDILHLTNDVEAPVGAWRPAGARYQEARQPRRMERSRPHPARCGEMICARQVSDAAPLGSDIWLRGAFGRGNGRSLPMP